MAEGSFSKLSSWFSSIFSHEVISDLPEAPVSAGKQSFLSWLLKPEDLPTEESERTGESRSMLSWLFAPESLPVDEGADQGAKPTPFLTRLFSREDLPFDQARQPTPVSRGRRR